MPSPSKSRRPKRHASFLGVLGGFTVVVLAAACFILTWPQALGLEQTIGIAQLISFRAALGIGAICFLVPALLILGAAPRGQRFLPGLSCLIVAAFIVAQGGILVMRGFSSGLVEGEPAADAIRVLSWNTRGDEPGSPTIAKLAVEQQADIVALPETTEEMATEVANLMAESGRPMWVHTRVFDEDYRATATSLLISPDLGDYAIDESRGDTSTLPTVIARPTSGEGPTIVAAHPIAPLPEHMQQWRSDLSWLALQCTNNTIMAGDFNATLDHLDRLGIDGADFGECSDAALSSRDAANGTWSAGVAAPLAAPIDHIMATSQWQAGQFEVIEDYDLAGSDHRPVAATLVAVSE